jgi:hypothetical protein
MYRNVSAQIYNGYYIHKLSERRLANQDLLKNEVICDDEAFGVSITFFLLPKSVSKRIHK